MLRDGMHQTAVHAGVAPYRPNSLDGGCPFLAGADLGGFIDVPEALRRGGQGAAEAPAILRRPLQPGEALLPQPDTAEQPTSARRTLRTRQVPSEAIRERQLQALAKSTPNSARGGGARAWAARSRRRLRRPDRDPSPALSQVGGTWPEGTRAWDRRRGRARQRGAPGASQGCETGRAEPQTHRSDRRAGGGPDLPHGQVPVEFDALVLVAAPAPGPDAHPDLDGKADTPWRARPGTSTRGWSCCCRKPSAKPKPIRLGRPRLGGAGSLRAGPGGPPGWWNPLPTGPPPSSGSSWPSIGCGTLRRAACLSGGKHGRCD